MTYPIGEDLPKKKTNMTPADAMLIFVIVASLFILAYVKLGNKRNSTL